MHTKSNKQSTNSHQALINSSVRAISFHSVQNKQGDRMYFIKNKAHQINTFISSTAKEFYKSLSMTFSLDYADFPKFKNLVWPIVSSGATFIIGEHIAIQMSRFTTESDDYDFVYKFLIGAGILGYCATQRITEKRLQPTVQQSAAIASEVLAIIYLYMSTFRGMKMLLDSRLSDDYSLVASLVTSSLVIPSGISYLTQKLQEKLIKSEYMKGAQRSDTALISSGLTRISNIYFNANHFLRSELMAASRLFQIALISDNILNAQKTVQKFRNLPALLVDVAPLTVKKIIAQQEKIKKDYLYNTALQKVLRFTKGGPKFVDVPRYQLKTGDLVFCDKDFDFSLVSVSGEVVAFQRDNEGQFTEKLDQKKFSVNLKAQNGEDVWIELKSKSTLISHYEEVDLHAIHQGKQAGVLPGDKLNVHSGDNFFIQIKPEKELILSSSYEKKSVINQIITERKQKSVLHSMLASIIMASLLSKDITTLPAEALKLMFSLFQMMIPFSESFLREMVNSRLMKTINQNQTDQLIETIDALRLVDFCNMLSGYYNEKFPKGIAIVSDKTGTLTTTQMNVLGLWTTDMKSDVQSLLKETESFLLPEYKTQLTCFEVFACAFTNDKKEQEPEEFALLQQFKSLLKNNECLQVSIEGKNHFKKTLSFGEQIKTIETFHLGLYRALGGRLTLVDDGKDKFLVFCGVPKQDKFQNTHLFASYSSMQIRSGVLSRDWCIARTSISDNNFATLKELFNNDKKQEIKDIILADPTPLKNMSHYCTFIIDNPLKKGAEKFVSQYRGIQIPVFVATGDTAKAAENIAKVLCPANTEKIITIRSNDEVESYDISSLKENELQKTTVIFAGINKKILVQFKQFLDKNAAYRPVIIFSEMSTEEKGLLTQFLKTNEFFVVANGDGTNDVMMMKNADMVIAHTTEEATYAPGVDQLFNLSDKQLQQLFGSEKSFYDLFDAYLPRSLFVQIFTPLANSQEKPSFALALKSSKISFDLAKAVGISSVKEMYQQHWFSVAFDLIWLGISFHEINASTDLPMDNQNIKQSHLMNNTMIAILVIACLQAIVTYVTTEESTNLAWMVAMLVILPGLLRSIFSAFKSVQNEIYPIINSMEGIPQKKDKSNLRSSPFNYIGSFFADRTTNQQPSITGYTNETTVASTVGM